MKYNLKEIQKFYTNNLDNITFVFETTIGRVVVKFDKSNFCHLLGIHHFDKKFKGIMVGKK